MPELALTTAGLAVAGEWLAGYGMERCLVQWVTDQLWH